MHREQRDYAEALAVGIEHGLLDAHEAVEWARVVLSDQAGSSDELNELAFKIRPHPLDIVSMLHRLPGRFDPVRVFRLVLRIARNFLCLRPDAWPQVTRVLEQIVLQSDLPEQLAEPCRRFDDQRLLAQQG